jgi:hypothetical protein
VKLIAVACLLLAACAPNVTAFGASPTVPPDWSIHDAAGLRIAAPAAWVGPDVLPATDSGGGPRAWVVFRDRSGGEAVTLMTWRDATASALAAAQYESERPRGDAPKELTVADGAQARTVIAMSGYAYWSDPSGAGTYECRHLYVQLDPRLVAVVIACGPHLNGNGKDSPAHTTPTPQLRHIQEQVALRLGVAGGAP